MSLKCYLKWQDSEKAFAVETFFKTNSIKETQKQFEIRFNQGKQHKRSFKVPSKQRIHDWVDKFKHSGSVKIDRKIITG